MTSQKTTDDVASNIDEASTVVEELQSDPCAEDGDDKLREIHEALDEATEMIEEMDDEKE